MQDDSSSDLYGGDPQLDQLGVAHPHDSGNGGGEQADLRIYGDAIHGLLLDKLVDHDSVADVLKDVPGHE